MVICSALSVTSRLTSLTILKSLSYMGWARSDRQHLYSPGVPMLRVSEPTAPPWLTDLKAAPAQVASPAARKTSVSVALKLAVWTLIAVATPATMVFGTMARSGGEGGGEGGGEDGGEGGGDGGDGGNAGHVPTGPPSIPVTLVVPSAHTEPPYT